MKSTKDNLIPMNKRTKDEQREICKKGGLASGTVRRKKKMAKQIIRDLLQQRNDFTENKTGQETVMESMISAMVSEALDGNVKAFEVIMKYAGEDPEEKRKEEKMQYWRDNPFK